MMIKRFVRHTLRRFGIIAFKRSSRVYVPEEESYRIVADLVGRPDPVIIDGGAHLGEMVEKFGALLPRAQFHCFEPDPALSTELARKFAGNARVHVVQAALGDKTGRATLNINASRPTNSLLDVSESLSPELKELARPVEQVTVDLTTIDEYCRTNSVGHVDAIKLDLQGYDYLALNGAINILDEVRVILVEVLYKEFYNGCHLFPDVLNFLLGKGFDLHTLSGLHYGIHDELLWSDAIFIRSDNSSKPMSTQRNNVLT